VRSFSSFCYSSENFHCSPNNPLNPADSDTLRVNAEPADAREHNYQNLLTRKAARKDRNCAIFQENRKEKEEKKQTDSTKNNNCGRKGRFYNCFLHRKGKFSATI